MPYHVLLVDDDSYFRDEFREFMEDFDVIEAANGQDALTILKQPHNIDLIIIDERLPDTKGTDLLEKVYAISPNIRTIILTGYSSKEVAIDAVKNQATDYIEKPLTSQKIEEIRNLLLSAPYGEKDRHTSGIKGKVEQAKYFAQRNYNKKLTLEDVASEVCLSPKYLSRVFKKNTGISFMDYKLNLRMAKAKELLIESGDNIEEISYKLGYRNPESFGKMFRKVANLAPREYRAKEKQKKYTSKRLREAKKQIGKDEKIIKKQVFDLTQIQGELEKEQYLARLGRLAAIVAHEMRRTFNGIQMAAWNIKKKVRDPSIDRNITCVEEMLKDGNQIISDLLHYSRVKNPIYTNVKIDRLLHHCIQTIKKIFTHKKVIVKKLFRGIENKNFSVDPVQFKQVISNVLTNAYEAFPDNRAGKIIVRADAKEGHLTVSVSDNGMGIDKDDLEKIFEPFFSHKHKGTGLGLSICKQIVEFHNGHIWLESQINKGTTVTIQLPLQNKI